MANLRDIRHRIRSVKNTAQITRAMQLVAASKMKRAQESATAGEPYAALMARILATLGSRIEDFEHPLLEAREVTNRGVIVLSTDKGLCGGLNANLFREISAQEGNVSFITVGRKATQYVSRTKRKLIADFNVSDKAGVAEIRPIIDFAVEAFTEGTIDTLEILYPRFINTLKQYPVLAPLLPLSSVDDMLKALGVEKTVKDEREIQFEPSVEEVLGELLPRFVSRELHQMVLSSKASEHSARMVAMKTATDNANNLVDSLTLDYNKARQAAITQEILEIAAATATNH